MLALHAAGAGASGVGSQNRYFSRRQQRQKRRVKTLPYENRVGRGTSQCRFTSIKLSFKYDVCMHCGWSRLLTVVFFIYLGGWGVYAQTGAQSSSSSSTARPKRPASRESGAAALEAGAVANGVFRNSVLGFSCKIPAGWVLRTEEMNAEESANEEKPAPQGEQRNA